VVPLSVYCVTSALSAVDAPATASTLPEFWFWMRKYPTPEMRAELVDWLESVWRSWNPRELIAWFERRLRTGLAPQPAARNLLEAPRELALVDNALF
jgi:hypothetical protein